MRGSLSVHCRALLIKREVNHEHACNSSYESHLALNNPVIYAFDNSNRDAFSNNKVVLKDDNNGTLVSLEMKRCLALWQPLFFFFFFTYCYLFILLFVTLCFSMSYQRLLMKENVESVLHLWQNASHLLRGGGSVLGCACYDSSPHLFPLACSSPCHSDREKKKNMCLLHIFNTLYWSFLFLLLLIRKPDRDT